MRTKNKSANQSVSEQRFVELLYAVGHINAINAYWKKFETIPRLSPGFEWKEFAGQSDPIPAIYVWADIANAEKSPLPLKKAAIDQMEIAALSAGDWARIRRCANVLPNVQSDYYRTKALVRIKALCISTRDWTSLWSAQDGHGVCRDIIIDDELKELILDHMSASIEKIV